MHESIIGGTIFCPNANPLAVCTSWTLLHRGIVNHRGGSLREIARSMHGVEIGIQAILARLDEKVGEEGNEEIGATEHQY